jgi:hypothetical protein
MSQTTTAIINTPPEMLTIRAAAKRGLLPERALRRLAAQGKLPIVRSGKTMYLNYTALVEQLQRGEGSVFE